MASYASEMPISAPQGEGPPFDGAAAVPRYRRQIRGIASARRVRVSDLTDLGNAAGRPAANRAAVRACVHACMRAYVACVPVTPAGTSVALHVAPRSRWRRAYS